MLSGHGVLLLVEHLEQISRAGLGDYGGGLSALLGASLELKEEGRRESGCADQLLGTSPRILVVKTSRADKQLFVSSSA